MDLFRLSLGLLLWLARPLLSLLPLPVLAAVVLAILSHNLWPAAVLSSLKLGGDGWLAVLAAAGVLLFGVFFGMLLAVAMSLVLAIRQFAQPLVSELGQLPGTRDYLDRARHPEVTLSVGTMIMRPEEPLFFANAEQVFQVVRQRAKTSGANVVVLSLEVSDDLDSTAVEALAELTISLRGQSQTLVLARVKDKPRAALIRMGLTNTGAEGVKLFWSVDDAVRASEDLEVALTTRVTSDHMSHISNVAT